MNTYARKAIRSEESRIRGAQAELAWCDTEPQDDPEIIAYRAQLLEHIAKSERAIAEYNSPEYAARIAADDDDQRHYESQF